MDSEVAEVGLPGEAHISQLAESRDGYRACQDESGPGW